MSYTSRSGHGYGQQNRHNSGANYYGQRKTKQSNFKVPSNKTLTQQYNEKPENSAAFNSQILVKVPATWTQSSLSGTLPNMDVKKQAFQLAQILATRKTLDLQLIEPNQNVLNFKVSKIEDSDSEIIEQQQNNTILPNQSYSSFEYVSSLRSELAQFGYSLVRQE